MNVSFDVLAHDMNENAAKGLTCNRAEFSWNHFNDDYPGEFGINLGPAWFTNETQVIVNYEGPVPGDCTNRYYLCGSWGYSRPSDSISIKEAVEKVIACRAEWQTA